MRVTWFETESAENRYGRPGEQDFATAAEALAEVERLKSFPAVIHVEYEVPPEGRPVMPDGEVVGQGWTRDDNTGVWRRQYVHRLGEPFEVLRTRATMPSRCAS